MSRPLLSIILPAHNEEQRLLATLEQVVGFLQAQPYPSEILVVENASQDRTYEIACDFAAHYQGDSKLHVLQETRLGKGMAVRLGMLAASGDYRFMCDADLSMPIEQVNRFLPPSLEGVDIVIASREAPGAVRYNEPAYRHLVGRIFNTLIRLLALHGLQDTQCGFKCFRAPVAEDVFRHQILAGWSFDVEVLYIAQKRGYRIVELPIPWYYHSNSKISVLRDSLQMALDLLVIRRNGQRGVYDETL
ncbi:MAG TPA: dolichyl-phosphate beta-glucosyltransferase [Anaerolineales bacterium]